MVGQKYLLHTVDKLVNNGFPRFSLIVGPTGSGKHLVAAYIASQLQAQLVVCGTKVDEVREMIALSYKQSEPTVYLFPDTDKMSTAAKNALLKVTEEPPRKAFIIITLADLANTLPTLTSRGCVFHINSYRPEELSEYINLKEYKLTTDETHVVHAVCTVPGEIDLIVSYDIVDFYHFVETVVFNIGKVNGANAFKIGLKLKYKEEDKDDYDVTLFLRTLMYAYFRNMEKLGTKKCRDSMFIISKYLQQLRTNGINKSATIDMLILELRGIWVEEE